MPRASRRGRHPSGCTGQHSRAPCAPLLAPSHPGSASLQAKASLAHPPSPCPLQTRPAPTWLQCPASPTCTPTAPPRCCCWPSLCLTAAQTPRRARRRCTTRCWSCTSQVGAGVGPGPWWGLHRMGTWAGFGLGSGRVWATFGPGLGSGLGLIWGLGHPPPSPPPFPSRRACRRPAGRASGPAPGGGGADAGGAGGAATGEHSSPAPSFSIRCPAPAWHLQPCRHQPGKPLP
jgi:hypothetical protein